MITKNTLIAVFLNVRFVGYYSYLFAHSPCSSLLFKIFQRSWFYLHISRCSVNYRRWNSEVCYAFVWHSTGNAVTKVAQHLNKIYCRVSDGSWLHATRSIGPYSSPSRASTILSWTVVGNYRARALRPTAVSQRS